MYTNRVDSTCTCAMYMYVNSWHEYMYLISDMEWRSHVHQWYMYTCMYMYIVLIICMCSWTYICLISSWPHPLPFYEWVWLHQTNCHFLPQSVPGSLCPGCSLASCVCTVDRTSLTVASIVWVWRRRRVLTPQPYLHCVLLHYVWAYQRHQQFNNFRNTNARKLLNGRHLATYA